MFWLPGTDSGLYVRTLYWKGILRIKDSGKCLITFRAIWSGCVDVYMYATWEPDRLAMTSTRQISKAPVKPGGGRQLWRFWWKCSMHLSPVNLNLPFWKETFCSSNTEVGWSGVWRALGSYQHIVVRWTRWIRNKLLRRYFAVSWFWPMHRSGQPDFWYIQDRWTCL